MQQCGNVERFISSHRFGRIRALLGGVFHRPFFVCSSSTPSYRPTPSPRPSLCYDRCSALLIRTDNIVGMSMVIADETVLMTILVVVYTIAARVLSQNVQQSISSDANCILIDDSANTRAISTMAITAIALRVDFEVFVIDRQSQTYTHTHIYIHTLTLTRT